MLGKSRLRTLAKFTSTHITSHAEGGSQTVVDVI